MVRPFVARFSAAIALLFALVDATPAPRTEILVGAASSLQDVLTAIGPQLEAANPALKVTFNFASSATLVRQIEAKAPMDAFVSADEANMDRLAAKDLLAPGSRADVTANELVLVVRTALPDGTVKDPADLAKADVKHVAVCDPAVPIGHYATDLLKKKGLDGKLEGRIVHPDNVRAALALVAGGSADAAFVYATDVAAAAGKVKVVWRATASDGVDVRYPAAALKFGVHPHEGKAFVEFLKTKPAQDVFAKFGFKSLPGA